MAQNPNQPRAYDVVLGGQISVPANAAVLGGLGGVQRRLLSPVVVQRVAALKEALKYGQSGLELAMEALQDSAWQVRQAAYLLIQDYKEPGLKQVLQEYNPYQLFQCHYRYSTAQSTDYAVTISSDGQLLISGGNDKTIKVRSLHTGKIIHTLRGHSGSIYAIVSRSNQFVVSGSWDSTIKVWSLHAVPNHSRVTPVSRTPSDGLLFTLTGHEAEVNSLAISPDGHTIASGGEDSLINLWDISTGELETTLSGHADGVKSVAISPDGKTLVSSSADETIKLWNLPNGELLHTLVGHIGGVRSIALSPDGRSLASGGEDKTIRIWQMHTGELLHILAGHWDEVNSVAISTDGQTLISGSRDETIRVWHLATGVELYTLEGHQGGVAAVAISPDAQKIVSSSWDHTIRVWGAKK